MKLTDDKVEFLKSMNYGQDQIADIERIAGTLSKARKQAGTVVKEVTQTEPETPATEEVTTTTTTEDTTAVVETPAFDKDALLKELADGLAEVLKPVSEAIVELRAQQKALDAKLDTALTKQLQATTPKLSFGELLSKQLMGTPEAAIDGRTALGSAAPTPTEQKNVPQPTGIPFVNNILAKQMGNQ